MTALVLEPGIAAEAPSSGGVRVVVERARRVFAGSGVVLDGLDLDVAAGTFVALLGPSGCGKSTLLRLVAGLDQADGGSVRLVSPDGATRPRIAYVFQDAHLLPWRDVLDNAALPLELSGVSREERREQALAALQQVGLGDAAARYPAELSGGMKMRVSLARALVTRPSILLLDEPFAALDELTRQRLDDQLRALWLDLGMTVLFVTHSNAEAAYLAERCIVFSRRPARILLDAPIDLPRERAASLRSDPRFARVLGPLQDALLAGEAP
ncbi:ABC transporter ATP-binding protein [Polyangium jinanense]|uniref:ABC transporter ATP-binding protein n=1 Tax=Polyangium jinanense TaxID=2829994 RepID=A0A9X3XFV3_9BACT|nr:ABC transporter ATP-binding protein [Polyangium jinanense]MDC3961788.1 ABC transporter ATP-binding protein [Polyangium jinanense]MDC3988318.1 ABC transporter ATP-binding protein [Polyangium jinanense]MDC3989515.1 ABC transporter ATP-binding protein [Polyangium jinanense]